MHLPINFYQLRPRDESGIMLLRKSLSLFMIRAQRKSKLKWILLTVGRDPEDGGKLDDKRRPCFNDKRQRPRNYLGREFDLQVDGDLAQG